MADWSEQQDAEVVKVELVLAADFPGLLEVAHDDQAPNLRLLCKRGHVVGRVRMVVDYNWHPYLVLGAHSEPGLSSATPGDVGELIKGDPLPLRVRAKCPVCSYDGRFTGAELLRRYALAWKLEWRDIPLNV